MKNKFEAYYFSHKGKRKVNEDFIISDPQNGIFIIADGLGGYDFGEVASEVASKACHEFLLKNNVVNQTSADEMVTFIYDKLELEVKDNPAHLGMGTTLACLQINSGHISSIHIGDSRIYYVDLLSSKFWRTRDDSLVQDLIEAEIITKEEAENHSHRNKLTKSISIDNKDKGVKATFSLLNFQFKKSLLFLCTDGILESYSEKSLLHCLREGKQVKKLIEDLEVVTQERSRDNTSAIIIEL